ncbi:MAG: RNA-binding protein [Sedimentisphaerales bacterium]|nr:RNA-binding protein [Sedimentisphaerales bacterium]
MKIYVGNIPFSVTEDDLQALFGEFGDVQSCVVLKDRMSGRSRGFGFVEMEDNDSAQRAISELNGKDMEGRALVVNEAQPRGERGGGGGGRRRDFR